MVVNTDLVFVSHCIGKYGGEANPYSRSPNLNTPSNFGFLKSTPNSPISVSENISMKIINMGHTNFLVKVEITWVQDPKSSLTSS